MKGNEFGTTSSTNDSLCSGQGLGLVHAQTQRLSPGQGLGKIQIHRISQRLLLLVVVLVLLLPTCIHSDDHHHHDVTTNIQKCMLALSDNPLDTTTVSRRYPLTGHKPVSSFAIIQSISSHNPPADFDSASALMR